MRSFFKRSAMVVAIAVLLIAATACGQTPTQNAAAQSATSKLTREQATAIAENALQGYNAGDYAAWSRDWSDMMKNGIKESDFLSFRDQLLISNGKYVSMATIELTNGKSPDFVRWVVIGNFERGQVRFNFAFNHDGDKVVGVFTEPVS